MNGIKIAVPFKNMQQKKKLKIKRTRYVMPRLRKWIIIYYEQNVGYQKKKRIRAEIGLKLCNITFNSFN